MVSHGFTIEERSGALEKSDSSGRKVLQKKNKKEVYAYQDVLLDG